ncbi:hypothetical protein CJ030_MR2G000915 [Morella rubra]|uniref:Uncharacterized protein n=1 Tax=Morella rubra TaxID=262757 RepID=A0A6A1WHG2_9ROSI|nr:hypothetical protein CJ030_MR2G000915 [Morella rubra]
MAFSSKLPLVLFFLSSLFLHAAIAELVCEDLPKSICAFSIASSGVYLPDLCERQLTNPHRVMSELMSSGTVAPGPVSGAPQSAPVSSISTSPAQAPL